MMKKVIFLIVVLLFAFGILAVSVMKTVAIEGQSASQNYKVEPVDSAILDKESTPNPAAMVQEEKADYFLAYPGILPDHFLYPVKMIRDRIWLWLTVEPKKKAELMLLFADKRLGAGKALIEGNKVDLGVSTLTKGEKYLQRAVAEIIKKDKEGNRILLEKLSLAALKHEEVLLELQEKVSGEAKGTLETILALTRQSQAQIEQALGE
jgi:hypothetical protein